ncbi:hypothetical protein FNF28_00634 [Cafeteria roenbergensis]|uniref:Uncharacterized protein n=1 Tax=Cafeteria roenbergensis TaxID=33653 RepID=A0A5A8E763_CAFRO|nr:hypothetical protein FNF28_00634 [Cafeteria roenbergensis]
MAERRLSMRQYIADQVTAALKAAAGADSCVLVFDEEALSILDPVLTQTEVLSLGYRILVKFESDELIREGKRRLKYYPLPVVYFMRATRGNAARVLEDYGTGVELHEPDMLESCCPCAFRGIGDELLKDADLRPWYADAKLLLIPGPPGASEGVAEVQGALRSAAEANPGKYASLLKHVGNAIETPFTCIPEVVALEDDLFVTNQPHFTAFFYSELRANAVESVALGGHDPFGSSMGAGPGIEMTGASLVGGPLSMPRSTVDAYLRAELDTTAWRIASLLICLRELPDIRFFCSATATARGPESQTPRAIHNRKLGLPAPKQPWSEALADMVLLHIQNWWRENPWWVPIGHGESSDRPGGAAVDIKERARYGDSARSAGEFRMCEPTEQATLLVMERLDDLSTVMVHDTTYQCVLQDLTKVNPAMPFDVTSGLTHRLDASDYVWSRIRHQQLSDASSLVVAGYEAMKEKRRRYDILRASNNVRKLSDLALREKFQRGERWDREFEVHQILINAIGKLICVPGTGGETVESRLASARVALGSDPPPATVLLDMADLEMAMLGSGISPATPKRRMSSDEITRGVIDVLSSSTCGVEEKGRLYVLWLLTQPSISATSHRKVYDCLLRSFVTPTVVSSALEHLHHISLVSERPDGGSASDMSFTVSASESKERAKKAACPDGTIVAGFPSYLSRLEDAAERLIADAHGKPRPLAPGQSAASVSNGLPVDEWRRSSVRVAPPGKLPVAALQPASRSAFGGAGDSGAAAAASSGAGGPAEGRDVDTDGVDVDSGAITQDESWAGGLSAELSSFGHGRSRAGPRAGASATPAAASSTPAAPSVDVYKKPEAPKFRGPRLIVFVLGGISPQEQSALARLSERTGREIIVGGTSTMTAGGFFQQLHLSTSAAITARVRQWAAEQQAASVGAAGAGGTPAGASGRV